MLTGCVANSENFACASTPSIWGVPARAQSPWAITGKSPAVVDCHLRHGAGPAAERKPHVAASDWDLITLGVLARVDEMIDALPVKAHIFKHKHQGKYQNTTGPSVIKCIVHKAPLTRQMQCSSRPTLLAASLSGKQIQQADVRHTCALEHQASKGSDSQRPSTPDGTPVPITGMVGCHGLGRAPVIKCPRDGIGLGCLPSRRQRRAGPRLAEARALPRRPRLERSAGGLRSFPRRPRRGPAEPRQARLCHAARLSCSSSRSTCQHTLCSAEKAGSARARRARASLDLRA